jgi:beta-phosphoglucomutase-like phosphatase (HAD superfamily)
MSETNGERSTRQQDSKSAISRDQYDAVLLDLDGVITDTASVHAACWKQMFDEYLRKRATQRGQAFRPFDPAADYRLYSMGSPASTAFAIFIEDALSGVEAGSNGNFELVIGVARKGNAEELRRHGAHLVVNDLDELVS